MLQTHQQRGPEKHTQFKDPDISLYNIFNVWTSFLRTGLYLDILAQEEGAHVWG